MQRSTMRMKTKLGKDFMNEPFWVRAINVSRLSLSEAYADVERQLYGKKRISMERRVYWWKQLGGEGGKEVILQMLAERKAHIRKLMKKQPRGQR